MAFRGRITWWPAPQSTAPQLFCVDCKWFDGPGKGSLLAETYAYCKSPQGLDPNRKISPVTGEPIDPRLVIFCDRARREDRFCGPSAAWFEPKEN